MHSLYFTKAYMYSIYVTVYTKQIYCITCMPAYLLIYTPHAYTLTYLYLYLTYVYTYRVAITNH